MGQFQPAIDFVLENEKGFVNNPNDSGKATNWGISLRFLSCLSADRLKRYGIFAPIDIQFIQSLTRKKAVEIYQGEFWEVAKFDQLENQAICTYIFDMCVEHGIPQGIKLAQRALWAVNRVAHCVIDDGVLGAETITNLNDEAASADIITALMSERAGFVRLLLDKYPKDREFSDGWIARCYRING